MPNEEDKKLDYLKREEVRTMGKDLTRLREKEAEIEREKIANLRTEEYLKLEQERTEQARIGAMERQKIEGVIRKKEEELKILREQREKREVEMEKGEVGVIESRKEEFREQLRETQQKEEEERKKFIERISAKAEGREPAPPMPLPAETPSGAKAEPKPPFKFPAIQLPKVQLPKVPLPKIEGYFPKGPSFLEKLWIRIIVSFSVFAILAAVGTFWYWYLVIREIPTETPIPFAPPVMEEVKIVKPPINENILQFGYYIPAQPRLIDAIIVHSVYNALGGNPYSLEGIIEEYKTYGVAAHYLIDRDGQIYQTAPEEAVAYHAGVSQMPDGRTDVNNFSVGIELIYTKDESPTDGQYLSLNNLIQYLREEYGIPSQNILGHKDIAPVRKDDPWNFDWGKTVEKLII